MECLQSFLRYHFAGEHRAVAKFLLFILCTSAGYILKCPASFPRFAKLHIFSFLTEESYTVRLPVNILNTVKEGESGKPFTKIGFIEFPSNATLSEIRQKLKKDFAEILQSKLFLFQDAMMADVEPSREEATKSIYNLSVIIRFTNEQGNSSISIETVYFTFVTCWNNYFPAPEM